MTPNEFVSSRTAERIIKIIAKHIKYSKISGYYFIQ